MLKAFKAAGIVLLTVTVFLLIVAVADFFDFDIPNGSVERYGTPAS